MGLEVGEERGEEEERKGGERERVS
jgi:hypothetical protein